LPTAFYPIFNKNIISKLMNVPTLIKKKKNVTAEKTLAAILFEIIFCCSLFKQVYKQDRSK